MANGWSIDKHISWGHILTTAVIAFGGVSAWFEMANRISLLEQKEAMRADAIIELKSSIDRMEDKLDSYILRGRS